MSWVVCVSLILIVRVVGIQRGAVVSNQVVVSMVCSVVAMVSMVCGVVVIPASICHVCFSIFENVSY